MEKHLPQNIAEGALKVILLKIGGLESLNC